MNVSAVPPSSNIKDGATKFEHRQVCSKILCGEKDRLRNAAALNRLQPFQVYAVAADLCKVVLSLLYQLGLPGAQKTFESLTAISGDMPFPFTSSESVLRVTPGFG